MRHPKKLTLILKSIACLIGAFLITSGISLPTQAQQNVLRIAAVVNDEIISVLDLEQRLRLVALSSNLQLDQQMRQRLLPQVLRGLIDEKLQLQEAIRNGITATDREIDQEIQLLAERNNIQPLQFPAFLAQQGIDIQTLRTQVEVGIAWAKYAGRRLSRQVSIGPEEIDEELERLRAVADKPQRRTFEIFLGVDSPDQSIKVRQNAERLLGQIRAGADFSSLASSFSESASANAGGDIGWIAPGQLPQDLDEVLQTLDAGMLSEPIRTLTGYSILYVADIQTIGRNPGNTTLSLFQLIQRLPQNATPPDKQQLLTELSAAAPGIVGCDAMKQFGDARENATVAAANDIKLSDLPGPTQAVVQNLQINQTSQPIDTGNALIMITVCAKEEAGLSLPSRDQIQERLGNQRLDLLVQRKMRDLRREAFIDIRL